MKQNPLGVMQGRLLPKYSNRYQAHPIGYWADEFPVAASLGLNCIEFIVDYNDAELNPLLKDGGTDEILRATEGSGVAVRSVCADYLMEAPLHHTDDSVAAKSRSIVGRLLDSGATLGVTDIVIPCVDQSSLADQGAEGRLVRALTPLVDTAHEKGINLSLETDLPPDRFASLLERFNSLRVTANYDTGNSAALGYDPAEEIAAYGERISDIHIKDRVRNGGSVALGTGDADFDAFFGALRKVGFTGPFILQAFRDDEGKEIFASQLDWVRQKYLEPFWS